MRNFGLSRDVPVKRGATALLFVDVQNYSAEGGGRYQGLSAETIEAEYGYFLREMRERTLPNMRSLQSACRGAGVEVMYTVLDAIARFSADHPLGILALDASTGTQRWFVATNASVAASPLVDDAALIVPVKDGSVYALNATTGALLWKTPVSAGVSSPALAGTAVVIAGGL